jgi:imidazolonepropionase-like amidohydrolase
MSAALLGWVSLVTGVVGEPLIAFENARVEVGDGTALERATVVVAGDKIVSVGTPPPPPGATRINAEGKVISPGLFHVGSQIGLLEISLEEGTVDTQARTTAPGLRAVDGFNPASPRVAVDRAQGVTSAVVAPIGNLLSGTGAVIQLNGQPPIGALNGGVWGAFGGSAREAAGVRGVALLELMRIFSDARFYRANAASFDKNASRPLALPPVHLLALSDVIDNKQPLVLAVDRESDIRALLAFAAAQKLRVIVWGGAEAWRLAPELAAAKVPVVVTPSAGEPFSFDALMARDDNAALLAAAGVPLIISSGGTDLGTTRVRQEAGIAVSYGLPYATAMQAITLEPARAFGATDRGVLAPGKQADIVMWSGDPLETRTLPVLVMIGGVKYEPDSRHTALAKRYRKRPQAPASVTR